MRLALRAAWGAAGATAALPVSAQTVVLALRPQVGDTIRMKLEQRVDMSGTQKVGGVDSTTAMESTLRVTTSAVVERSDTSGVWLTSTTDSVEMVSGGAHAGPRTAAADARVRDALTGRVVRLHVRPDGTTEVVGADGTPTPVNTIVRQLPAMLPSKAVAPGTSWTRTMGMPGAPATGRPAGAVIATFRLDSLNADATLAFLSLKGAVSRAESPPSSGATHVTGGGSLAGTLVIDRRRGWVSEAHTTLDVKSTVTPPASRATPPLHVRMRVTEWLRAVER